MAVDLCHSSFRAQRGGLHGLRIRHDCPGVRRILHLGMAQKAMAICYDPSGYARTNCAGIALGKQPLSGIALARHYGGRHQQQQRFMSLEKGVAFGRQAHWGLRA